MPAMAPRYPEGSLGVWASPKPTDGGSIFCQWEYPRSAGRQGSPSISFPVRAMGPPPPGNGSPGVQANGQLCVLGGGTLLGRSVAEPGTLPGLRRACACLKAGWARAQDGSPVAGRQVHGKPVEVSVALGWALTCMLHPEMRVFVTHQWPCWRPRAGPRGG